MTFSNIFDRIGSKLIGLKFVGSSISPNLWIDIIIECVHSFGNTFVNKDKQDEKRNSLVEFHILNLYKSFGRGCGEVKSEQ